MRNINWISRLFISISLSILVAYLFSYPKTIIEHFSDRNTAIGYFISDLNRFTYIYMKINLFYAYTVYFPFVYLSGCFFVFKFVNQSIFVKIIRRYIFRVYTHVVTICFIHFDFSFRITNCLTESLFSNIQTMDITNIIIQYFGLYWDFITVIWFINGRSIACIELITVRRYFNYIPKANGIIVDFSKSLIQFKKALNMVWTFRIMFYSINRYFFGGDCRVSDISVMLSSFFIAEFMTFSFRFFFVLKKYTRMLISILSYLLLKVFFIFV